MPADHRTDVAGRRQGCAWRSRRPSRRARPATDGRNSLRARRSRDERERTRAQDARPGSPRGGGAASGESHGQRRGHQGTVRCGFVDGWCAPQGRRRGRERAPHVGEVHLDQGRHRRRRMGEGLPGHRRTRWDHRWWRWPKRSNRTWPPPAVWISRSCRVDLAELWKRTVLNLLVGNKDNHLRNHGFQPHHDRAVRDGFDAAMRQRTREVLGERPAPSCWISPHMTPPLDRWGDAVSVGARFAHRSPLHVAPAPNAPRRCERRGRAVKGARAV